MTETKTNSLKRLKRFLRRVKGRISNVWYETWCFLFPHNVVKMTNCPRTWTDRDFRMFHAMFQIIVDFVELEMPFVDWNDKDYGKKRFTDIEKMREHIQKNYGPDADVENMFGPGTDTDPKLLDQAKSENVKAYSKNMEILYLYVWYRESYPTKEEKSRFSLVNKHYDFTDHGIVELDNKDGVITTDEWREIEEENDLVEDIMLTRILKIRRYLWT